MEKVFYSGAGLFSVFFVIVAVFIGAVFIFIIGNFVKIFVRRQSEKRYNDSQPVLTKGAKITGKRTAVSGGSGNSSVSTSYYATFEFADNKERLELRVPSKDYGLLADDDSGNLTFQGRRYLQFQRN
jgi:Protein of unknown function (DUF2500)